jgi:hypothetical protein
MVAYADKAAEGVRRVLSGRSDLAEKEDDGRDLLHGERLHVLRRHRLRPHGSGRPRSVPADARWAACAADGVCRPTPDGFVLVDPEGYQTDPALATWIQRGLDFVAASSEAARCEDIST